jgi:hypothetical protein
MIFKFSEFGLSLKCCSLFLLKCFYKILCASCTHIINTEHALKSRTRIPEDGILLLNHIYASCERKKDFPRLYFFIPPFVLFHSFCFSFIVFFFDPSLCLLLAVPLRAGCGKIGQKVPAALTVGRSRDPKCFR